jgi:TetR/AcrR family transcriptional regulator, repressor of fatR-cypB operon
MNVRSTIIERAAAEPASDGTSKRRPGRPVVDDKRRRILDAALRTFAARGYHGTSVPEVAAAADVGVGTLYRYFEDKNALVNELYRDAKLRLKAALLEGLPPPNAYQLDNAQRWFSELWRRLATFASTEPDAFRFLEMQDHVEYLDAESRALELSVLAPLWLAGKRLRDQTAGPPIDVAIALLWGAFVGLVKASRLGYLPLDDKKFEQAGAAAWRMLAPELSRATARAEPSASPPTVTSKARATSTSRATSAAAATAVRKSRATAARKTPTTAARTTPTIAVRKTPTTAVRKTPTTAVRKTPTTAVRKTPTTAVRKTRTKGR